MSVPLKKSEESVASDAFKDCYRIRRANHHEVWAHTEKHLKGAGVYFILPCTDTLTKVDMRTKALELPFQEIFTKDPLVIDVDGVVYYRIQDAILAVTKVSDADMATNLLAKAIVKNTLGTQTLSHLISDRGKVAKEIQVLLGNVTADWGVTIEQVEIKNVKTRVNVVSPGNVTPQSRVAKEVSVFLQDNPVSIQLRCLKADSTHPSPHTSTIIFT